MAFTEKELKEGIFSSKDMDWATPQYFVDLVEEKFGIRFDLDVCAYDHTAKAKKWFTEEDDALKQDWNESVCWMNPPYGSALPKWLDYAYEQHKKHGNTIVCLVPARTDTVWFHKAAERGCLYLLKGRIAFERANGQDIEHKPGAFGSMLIIFSNNFIFPKEQIFRWEWKNELSRNDKELS